MPESLSAFQEGKTLLYWKSPHSFSLLIRTSFLREVFPKEVFGRFSRKAILKPYAEDGKKGIIVLFSEKETAQI
ncbi:MAG: hypothetical protein AABW68_04885 [archaeon]